jgi:hypothetical protein
VIQQANQERSSALATNNPSQMSDTATAAYYRQLVQINQALVAQGATSINLIRLTWGPINVSGTTATANASEAWTTTFSDGTTNESSDTNVYTLVQQNGTWLIESDQQTPTASTQATPGTGAQTAPSTPVPAAPVGANTSHNWSGYAATAGTYTGVTGTGAGSVAGSDELLFYAWAITSYIYVSSSRRPRSAISCIKPPSAGRRFRACSWSSHSLIPDRAVGAEAGCPGAWPR